jgi:hypothetical protein
METVGDGTGLGLGSVGSIGESEAPLVGLGTGGGAGLGLKTGLGLGVGIGLTVGLTSGLISGSGMGAAELESDG